jgi:hypothetical protein
VNEPGIHRGQLQQMGGQLLCQAHRMCSVVDAGSHGGTPRWEGTAIVCGNHSDEPTFEDQASLVEEMIEVARSAEEQYPLPPPPTPRSRKNIPQRGRPRVKSKRR